MSLKGDRRDHRAGEVALAVVEQLARHEQAILRIEGGFGIDLFECGDVRLCAGGMARALRDHIGAGPAGRDDAAAHVAAGACSALPRSPDRAPPARLALRWEERV